jgi:tetratricopeptide (TPR) repeat protein
MFRTTTKKISLCVIYLFVFQAFLGVLNAQDTGRPKILILPPVTEVDKKVAESFQWDLAKALDGSGTFDIVNEKQYKNYLKGMKLDRQPTIPDSVVPLMMDSLKVSIYTKGTLDQPGGKGTELKALVDFIYPRNDFTIEGEEQTVADEKQTKELSKQVAEVIIRASEKISCMSIARDYYNSSIYFKAIEYYNKFLTFEPNSINTMYLIATSYLKMDSIDTAVSHYENILANVDPEHIPSRDILAKTFFGREDFENAYKHYKVLAEMKPDEYEYTQFEAYSLYNLEPKDRSLDAFNRLIEIKDEDPGIRNTVGYLYYSKALELEQAGDSASVREQAKLALRHFQRMVEMYKDPESSTGEGQNTDPDRQKKYCDAINWCALCYIKAGDIPNALKEYSELVSVDPAYSNAYYYMFSYANKLKRSDDVLRYGQEALKYTAENLHYSIYSIMGRIYYREKKNFTKAIETYTKALTVAPANRKLITLLFRGLSYYDMAQRLDYSHDENADMNDLIDQGKMTSPKAEQALANYDKSLADLNKVTSGRYAKSAKAHISNIAQLKKRLEKIGKQIDYYEQTK